MRLSVLVLSLHTRVERFLPRIMATLHGQVGERDVEILCFLDNQRVSVGRKWNTLIECATGDYITVVGDDDVVSDDYIDSLLGAIDAHSGVDAIVFDTEFYRDGEYAARVHWGMEYQYKDDWDAQELWRGTGELMAIRSDIRKKYLYEDVWRGSDWRQAKLMTPHLKTQQRILGDDGQAKVLYKMLNRSDNDEHIKAQQRANAQRKAERAKKRAML